MIVKELDPFTSQDKLQIAGRKAEEQMAHYLLRFFGKSGEVDVINYLRIEIGGEIAQIDHLVLHPYGVLIVESKSVSSGVEIKDDGQWIRWFNKQPSGMRSPVTQAKMQSLLLKELLEAAVKQKGFFDKVRFDVLVAISDTGTIKWPSSGALPEVCKADQVHERIQTRVDQFRRVRQEPDILTAEHRKTISTYLLRVHKPLTLASALKVEKMEPVVPTAPAAATPNTTLPSAAINKVCKACSSQELEVRYGSYGYYFYCFDCNKNTGIKFACSSCGAEGRVRKQSNQFFAECKKCDASQLLHTNKTA
jgi:hypothetical protein